MDSVLRLVSYKCFKFSLFTNKYSRSKHFKVLFPRSLERQSKFTEKHPEISRPSKLRRFSKSGLKDLSVKRFRNLKFMFFNY